MWGPCELELTYFVLLAIPDMRLAQASSQEMCFEFLKNEIASSLFLFFDNFFFNTNRSQAK